MKIEVTHFHTWPAEGTTADPWLPARLRGLLGSNWNRARGQTTTTSHDHQIWLQVWREQEPPSVEWMLQFTNLIVQLSCSLMKPISIGTNPSSIEVQPIAPQRLNGLHDADTVTPTPIPRLRLSNFVSLASKWLHHARRVKWTNLVVSIRASWATPRPADFHVSSWSHYQYGQLWLGPPSMLCVTRQRRRSNPRHRLLTSEKVIWNTCRWRSQLPTLQGPCQDSNNISNKLRTYMTSNRKSSVSESQQLVARCTQWIGSGWDGHSPILYDPPLSVGCNRCM